MAKAARANAPGWLAGLLDCWTGYYEYASCLPASQPASQPAYLPAYLLLVADWERYYYQKLVTV